MEMTRARWGGVPWTISLTLRRRRLGRWQAARRSREEEELIRMASEWDAFRSRAGEATTLGKVLAGQLGAEQSAHQLMKGALDEALTVAEAS